MRIILFILLFISLQSKGQIIRANPNYRPFATAASCSYLLDQYSGAAAAYSLRKLDCDYAGSAIRVRRSSDNTEQDIGFTANGDLDTASLKTFVGANSAYITTWYDQAGSLNVTISTANYQPRIINAGTIHRINSLPSIFFDGSDDQLMNCSFTINTSVLYSFCVSNNPSNSGYGRIISISTSSVTADNNNLYSMAFLYTRLTDMGMYRNGFLTIKAITNNSTILAYNYIDGTSSGLQINNGTLGTTATSATALNSTCVSIGASVTRASGEFLTGYIQEIVLYRTDVSGNSSGIKSNINTYYQIY